MVQVAALRVGRAIDGVSAIPLEQAVINVTDGRIDSVVPFAADPQVHALLDFGPDSTALPGLVDAHTHFTLLADGRSYEEMASESDELLAIAAARNAAIHLRSGVTTARDNGSRNMLGFVLRDAIDRGFVDGPRLLVAGRPVTPTRGHFDWCNGTADGADEIRRAIRRLVAEGANHIKVMASGGGTVGTDPTRASYTRRELEVVVETARELGRLTTAHCRAAEGMRRAIQADIDCMEHGEFLRPDGGMAFDADLARELVDSPLYLSPTLQSNGGWDTILRSRKLREEDALDAPGVAALAAAEQELETRLDHINRLISLGLGPRLVCGTDAGCFDYSFGHMDYGISLMVDAGLTPMEALRSATSVSAAACGVGDEVGSLSAGKQADILVVDGDPLIDLSAMGRPVAVIKGGRLVVGPEAMTASPVTVLPG